MEEPMPRAGREVTSPPIALLFPEISPPSSNPRNQNDLFFLFGISRLPVAVADNKSGDAFALGVLGKKMRACALKLFGPLVRETAERGKEPRDELSQQRCRNFYDSASHAIFQQEKLSCARFCWHVPTFIRFAPKVRHTCNIGRPSCGERDRGFCHQYDKYGESHRSS